MPSPPPDNPLTDKESRFQNLTALAICAVNFFLWLHILITKFTYMGYYDWDLALYANAMWNLSRGSFHSSLFGTNFFTNHAEYFSFFLVPFYRFLGHPFFLIVLKLLSLSGGAFVFYLIARKYLGWPIAILFLVLYQTFPANLFMLIYEFHFENLALIFLFLMYYFFSNQKLKSFLITAFFASLIKENIALIVAMFGLYAMLAKRDNKFAWIAGPLLIGGGMFFLSMFVVTPYLRTQSGLNTANQYLSLYWAQSSQNAPGDILLANLRNAWNNAASPLNIEYIKELLGPVNFLPLLNPLVLFLAGPVVLQHFICPAPQMHQIYFHYAATLVPFIFLATIGVLAFLKVRARPLVYYAVLLLTAVSCVFNISRHWPVLKGRMDAWTDRLDSVRWQMVNAVPPEASIIATFDFLDKLSHRKSLYSLHNVWRDINPFTAESPYRLPEDLSMALIDWGCYWMWGDIHDPAQTRQVLERLSRFYFDHDWTVKDAVEDIVLFQKRRGEGGLRLVDVRHNPFILAGENLSLTIDQKFQLINFSTDEEARVNTTTLPITMIWKAQGDVPDIYGLVIHLKKDGKTVFRWNHHIGYGVYPTALWKKEDYVKERYWIMLPSLQPGEYVFSVSAVNITQKKEVQLSRQGQAGNAISVMKLWLNPQEDSREK